MATKKEKEELIQTLKFTPIKVQMMIQGYGGESYAGTVDRKIYDYFAQQRIDMDEYAGDWDGVFSDHVPIDLQPFNPGSPYDCENLWHMSGAELSASNEIRIDNVSTGETIWEHSCGYSELENAGATVDETGGTDLDDLAEGTVVFWGGQGEKGCFFDAEFTLTAPFDPKKLTVNYENCDGWYLISSVEYDGEELDGSGGYSTTGKWAEHKWILIGDEEVYDSVLLDEREDEGLEWDTMPESACNSETWDPAEELEKIELPMTDWYPADTKPVRKGEYEVDLGKDIAWPFSRIIRAEWSGRTWKNEEGASLKSVVAWRGLAIDPVEMK